MKGICQGGPATVVPLAETDPCRRFPRVHHPGGLPNPPEPGSLPDGKSPRGASFGCENEPRGGSRKVYGVSLSSSGAGRSEAEAMIAEAKKALWVMVGLIALIWILQVVNWLGNYTLSRELGIIARDPGSLPDIFTAEFVHHGWAHIEANSGPLFIFGFLAAFRGVKKWLWVTLFIVIVSGLGVWATSADNSITVGASGLLFGYLGYVIFRGLFDRRLIDIVIGVVLALSFAYTFVSLLPLAGEGISWQGHLFGVLAGVAGGWFLRERKAKPDKDNGLPTTLIN